MAATEAAARHGRSGKDKKKKSDKGDEAVRSMDVGGDGKPRELLAGPAKRPRRENPGEARCGCHTHTPRPPGSPAVPFLSPSFPPPRSLGSSGKDTNSTTVNCTANRRDPKSALFLSLPCSQTLATACMVTFWDPKRLHVRTLDTTPRLLFPLAATSPTQMTVPTARHFSRHNATTLQHIVINEPKE